jgi:hypothetical protein
MKLDFEKYLNWIKTHPLVSSIINVFVDEIAERGVYRIKSQLVPSAYKLEIRWIVVENHLTYSYQLYADAHLLRWDNAPHYPDVATFPHHFHEGNITASSPLTGNVEKDLEIVFSALEVYFVNNL